MILQQQFATFSASQRTQKVDQNFVKIIFDVSGGRGVERKKPYHVLSKTKKKLYE